MKKLNLLSGILALNGETQHKNKKGKKNQGSTKDKFVPYYTTLKVIPRSKRTPENCNAQGIAKSETL